MCCAFFSFWRLRYLSFGLMCDDDESLYVWEKIRRLLLNDDGEGDFRTQCKMGKSLQKNPSLFRSLRSVWCHYYYYCVTRRCAMFIAKKNSDCQELTDSFRTNIIIFRTKIKESIHRARNSPIERQMLLFIGKKSAICVIK